jgi:hypothetical protein
MVTLRPTRKLRTALPVTESDPISDTALGDWYINRLVVDRKPLLLLVSSASLLPMLVRARDVRELPRHVEDMVAHRLARLGVATLLIDAERRAMRPVQIGAAVDRSVLGIMVDFAKACSTTLRRGGTMALLKWSKICWRKRHVTQGSDRSEWYSQTRRRPNY